MSQEQTDEHMDKEDLLIEEMAVVVDKNHVRREKILEKLMPAVDNIDLGQINMMKASDRESLMGVFSTTDSIMKSQEGAQEKKIKVHLQKKSDDVNADSAAQVLEVLKRINPTSGALLATGGNGNVATEEEQAATDAEIERIANEECNPISEDELHVDE